MSELIKLEPGDRVVLRPHREISMEQAQEIKHAWSTAFPDVKVVVLTGADLSVLTPHSGRTVVAEVMTDR